MKTALGDRQNIGIKSENIGINKSENIGINNPARQKNAGVHLR